MLFSPMCMGYAKYSLAMKGSPDPISSESFVLLLLPSTEEDVLLLLASCSPMMGLSLVESMFTMGKREGTSLEAGKFCSMEEEETVSASL